ncbi:MAG TPA: aminoacyl-tRNA hydrolase [Polyangiaceae bacterium LLY-WYZ-15_(1-7)]|nr:aminoacyl-tRNA hydrolase [Sandaracinus sp.]HJL01633.1 aminoacyl-tRNA hydrolase [Polyangiaceae bacterium LLY-WYZ-15_(1-7)]HJL08673.1 aminoacyl-tRNA hydrolase [Polyangiaceae bacterium LLY-WYZ-15_(1-7)]HJL30001.1 aminoacyl-tRNA hydrolase [Polyangiaceae bacterium LLY-WYZ-15_(1-7)]HJL36983.1 aminoacyl-tRNA hydrolase [Polyangiaceae bacterium LLY-WYZ-15_(1-7)]
MTETPPSEAKQVLVVRKDLRMRKGKIAAQCAHASMKVLLERMAPERAGGEVRRTLRYRPEEPLGAWLDGRFTKVCVYVESEEALDAVYAKARELGVPVARIVDSGRTEFGGVPTKTVVAVGPDWRERVDLVTGDLPLL